MPPEIIFLVMFGQMVNAMTNAWNGKRMRTQQWTQHSQNIGFQKERFEKEKAHQRDLEEIRRQTQLEQARGRLREAYNSREVNKIFETWPLKLAPSQYLMGRPQQERVPLKIIVAPPDGKRVSRKQLEQGLRVFIEKNYSLHNPIRPVEFLGGAWDDKQLRTEASVKALFSMLQSAPTLILESQLIEDDLNLYMGYWGIAQQEYCFQHVAKISYIQLLTDKARKLALEWRTICEKLCSGGLSPAEAQQYGKIDAENLKVFEEEERIKKLLEDDDDLSKLNFQKRYEADERHYTAVCDDVIAYHCLLAGCIIDVYHLLHYDVPPLLPRLLPELTASLPEDQVVPLLNNLAYSYCAAYEALEAARPAWAPEFSLDLAQSLVALPDKVWAERQVERSIRAWLRLHNVSDVSTEEMIPQLKYLLTPDDREYVAKLKHSLLAIGHDVRAAQLDAVY